DKDGRHHGNQSWHHHPFNRRLGHNVHTGPVLRLAGSLHDPFDRPELPAYLFNHETGSLPHGFHTEGSEDKWQHPAQKESNQDERIGEIKGAGRTAFGYLSCILREKHDRRETGRPNGITLRHGFGGVPDRVQWIGDVPHFFTEMRHFSDSTSVI